MTRQRPLPRDTNRLANNHWFNSDNLGLLLDKYQPWMRLPNNGGWDTGMAIEQRRQGAWQEKLAKGGEAKGYWFSGAINGIRLQPGERWLEPDTHIHEAALTAYRKRLKEMVVTQPGVVFFMWSDAPLVVGQGAESTMETALTLHPIYGFPIIPGSSLKGLARAVAFYALAEQVGVAAVDNEAYMARYRNKSTPMQLLDSWLEAPPAEQAGLANRLGSADEFVDLAKLAALSPSLPQVEQFRRIFGWRDHAGDVVFHEAVPGAPPQLAGDVMTPHFFEYYSAGGDPNDADAPKPVSFLTVGRGIPFQFGLGLRIRTAAPADVYQARTWLREGLTMLGIGGKIAAGYGYFSEEKPDTATRLQGPQEGSFISLYNQRLLQQEQGRPAESEPRSEDAEPSDLAERIFRRMHGVSDDEEDS